MDNNAKNGRRWLVPLASAVLSFIVGVVLAAYVIGQRTGKVLDLQEWKNETAPRIERMDGQGTLSFKLFHEEYLRTQNRQEAKLMELEQRLYDKEMDDIRLRLKDLEQRKQ